MTALHNFVLGELLRCVCVLAFRVLGSLLYAQNNGLYTQLGPYFSLVQPEQPRDDALGMWSVRPSPLTWSSQTRWRACSLQHNGYHPTKWPGLHGGQKDKTQSDSERGRSGFASWWKLFRVRRLYPPRVPPLLPHHQGELGWLNFFSPTESPYIVLLWPIFSFELLVT